jgi:small subunit ribosomal protein S19e
MVNIKTIEPGKYNLLLAEALKKIPEFKSPEFIEIVKTSSSKERPTTEKDFWHKRAASILRQIYINGIVGVNRLRTRYGSRKNKGKKPSHHIKSGGKIIRTILQQAESAQLIEKTKVPKAGRQLTAKGKELLESITPNKVEKTE